jgi:hypothetical protein
VGDDLADATDSVLGDYLSIGPVSYIVARTAAGASI